MSTDDPTDDRATHRTASLARTTSESSVSVRIDLDGTGRGTVSTGVRFYDHMLLSLAKHSLIDLDIEATGDIDVDAHHTVEDVAILLGDALKEALGDKTGISRFGDATVPLDEALVQAVVDVAGRPYAVHVGEPSGQEYVVIGGQYVGSLTRHVIETLAHHAGIALHVRVISGRDPHHIVEAQFKAIARALRAAVARDPRVQGVPSAKGVL
ncbi:imidazoleglycerol-phosphate dehydratase HisB [Nostocoides sp. F2B08]|uniref:imidazoleglycerol-phosphate dehydratase HisB n=1 Tax=Nostocoides sp. F2B08 TaxID=2653936 RepID=UPI001262E9E4|nr:imidazoleglycerol-phosphate dehydratase HisB [Tetrasphaera sp. F2B08]KAB7744662.1 imidazoleglycerol-phosphate dehydratase HisB [Tetrasphaera sp. F2B08]